MPAILSGPAQAALLQPSLDLQEFSICRRLHAFERRSYAFVNRFIRTARRADNPVQPSISFAVLCLLFRRNRMKPRRNFGLPPFEFVLQRFTSAPARPHLAL